MTSLIDVIFLLVIFFMVSSQLTQFSLIKLAPTGTASEDGQAPTQATATSAPPLVVRILDGRISIEGRSVAVDQLQAAVTELVAREATELVLLPSATATVQDLVFALEAGKEAGIANITIVERGGVRP